MWSRVVQTMSRALDVARRGVPWLARGAVVAPASQLRLLHAKTPRHAPDSPPPGVTDIQPQGPPPGWERRFGGATAFPDFIEHWTVGTYYKFGSAMTVGVGAAAAMGLEPLSVAMLAAPVAGYWITGWRDMSSRHAIRRNFPVLGNIRYLLETLRPEIRQYFIEGDLENLPFNRMERSSVYQRAKGFPDSMPFGTRLNTTEAGFEYALHSMFPKHVAGSDLRVVVGGPHCKQPYSASVLNVSGMSFGAISSSAVRALTQGAKFGQFYVNTGEGGISQFHLEAGCDLVWNVGTGYFGCRNPDGSFSPENFKANATRDQVKMVEIKLSQGAKPAHGGILPKEKLTKPISEARGVPMGEDCNSPPRHSAFDSPQGLMQFVAQLRELSGGKPVGFKLCMGQRGEFLSLVKAMVDTGITPDFITVDGGEGGTGAAPPEFSNRVGMPLTEGLILANQALEGAGIRDRVRIICSGKVLNAFDVVRNIAVGADLCNSARAMMFALGCIQALKCNTNKCPTGIATQDERLMGGLVVEDKAMRVYRYQRRVVHTAAEIVGAMGLATTEDLKPEHITKRMSVSKVRSYEEMFPSVPTGALLRGEGPQYMQDRWN